MGEAEREEKHRKEDEEENEEIEDESQVENKSWHLFFAKWAFLTLFWGSLALWYFSRESSDSDSNPYSDNYSLLYAQGIILNLYGSSSQVGGLILAILGVMMGVAQLSGGDRAARRRKKKK
mmetsp:Transcript_15509/g.43980  ORF Transcript_15509/g.43980 Transcript_15509/m.43980 type:complete len:121 (+) Transcript_15509:116-478(+)